ncbi:hypothetical protein FHS15_004841 [Paenibacillus castaneae]|uniref:DUF6886 family protein n=1 Tax=Paenibacillus castaneae TaxID=474957 RepID=UPI000C998364|nr:DUF6886 family protein [Paenibacillus castaneae]NIK79680.1 hypothetical protein [Paenibacillus castaneae]
MLYHFSENPDINKFVPQLKQNIKEMPPVVWAIDEEHSVNYLFPRDCPRVIYSKSDQVTPNDMERFFSSTAANTIISVETSWLERIHNTTIFKYTFEERQFKLLDSIAGYYVSSETIVPVSVEPVNNLISKLLSRGIELRITPNLYPIRNAILSSSVDDFSIIRFNHAAIH